MSDQGCTSLNNEYNQMGTKTNLRLTQLMTH